MTESEIKELQEQNYEMSKRIEKLQNRLAKTVHELSIAQKVDPEQVVELREKLSDANKRAKKATKELKKVKKLLFERNQQYQFDCIKINKLHVTVETLSERLAQYMRMQK